MSASTPERAARNAFVRGLSKITKDKRQQEQLATRFDTYVKGGGNPRDSAGTLYLETAIKLDDPDTKYNAAIAVYDDATGRVPMSDRDAKHHPGQRRVPTAAFIDKEYNPFKTKTNSRLASIEEQLKGADALLRVLAVKEVKNAQTRALVSELDDIKRGYARLDAVKSDDPAITEVNSGKHKKLDERFKALYKAASKLVEATDREVALHARVIDDQNLQLGAHTTQLAQHDTMLQEHDRVITKTKSGSQGTGLVALIALAVAAVIGFIAFLIKLSIVIHDRTTMETIRGVTVEMVRDYSQLNGFGPAVLVGLLVGSIVFVLVCIVGFIVVNRRQETADETDSSKSETPSNGRLHRLLHGDDAPADSAEEPDGVDQVNSMLTDETQPVPVTA